MLLQILGAAEGKKEKEIGLSNSVCLASTGCEVFFIFAPSKTLIMLIFKCPLLAVADMEKSIGFYEEVIGDRVAFDFGENEYVKRLAS